MRYLAGGYALDVESVLGSRVFAAEGEGAVVARCTSATCRGAASSDSRDRGLVDLFARRLQVQERLTEQVSDALVQALVPKGVVVIAQARHLCMTMRGVQKQNAVTLTRALRELARAAGLATARE